MDVLFQCLWSMCHLQFLQCAMTKKLFLHLLIHTTTHTTLAQTIGVSSDLYLGVFTLCIILCGLSTS